MAGVQGIRDLGVVESIRPNTCSQYMVKLVKTTNRPREIGIHSNKHDLAAKAEVVVKVGNLEESVRKSRCF